MGNRLRPANQSYEKNYIASGACRHHQLTAVRILRPGPNGRTSQTPQGSSPHTASQARLISDRFKWGTPKAGPDQGLAFIFSCSRLAVLWTSDLGPWTSVLGFQSRFLMDIQDGFAMV